MDVCKRVYGIVKVVAKGGHPECYVGALGYFDILAETAERGGTQGAGNQGDNNA